MVHKCSLNYLPRMMFNLRFFRVTESIAEFVFILFFTTLMVTNGENRYNLRERRKIADQYVRTIYPFKSHASTKKGLMRVPQSKQLIKGNRFVAKM